MRLAESESLVATHVDILELLLSPCFVFEILRLHLLELLLELLLLALALLLFALLPLHVEVGAVFIADRFVLLRMLLKAFCRSSGLGGF